MRTPELDMDEIYANVDCKQRDDLEPQKKESILRKLKRNFVFVLLGLLSFFLLAGLVGLAVAYCRLVRHYGDIETNLTLSEDLTAERDSLVTNLTHHLQTSRDQLSAMTAERDSLKVNLREQSRQLERLRPAPGRHCPDGWTRFNSNCYLLSTQYLTWENARRFCIREGADLVTINNAEEQSIVSGWITGHTWIGLNDREQEGTWRWAADNSPLFQAFWAEHQPDNWGENGKLGNEDCVHIEGVSKKWNDRGCDDSLNSICEKNMWCISAPVV